MAADAPRSPQDENSAGGQADLWKYVSLGSQLAMTVLVFVGIGWWLDQKFGWSPWGVLLSGSAGVAAGLYHFVKDSLK